YILCVLLSFCLYNPRAPPQIYTLSLHDALPISLKWRSFASLATFFPVLGSNCINPSALACETAPGLNSDSCRISDATRKGSNRLDRKSTRLNSSHQIISYAVFCLKKKTTTRLGY